MSSLFSPKVKTPPAAMPPTIDEAKANVDLLDRLRKRRGRRASILTGALGDPAITSDVKRLLG